MRTASVAALAFSAVLGSTAEVSAQAGRYIPIPRVPSPGGGGHFIPHLPIHGGGQGNDDGFWGIVAFVGIIVLLAAGWYVGRRIGYWLRSMPQPPKVSSPPGPTVWQATAPPPMQDLILLPAEVADKAEQTRRLLEFLAHQDSAFEPGELQKWIAMTFVLVQKAWQARDYHSVRDLVLPGLLARHESLLKAMRQNHEINRIDDLRIERLEFVHLHCPHAHEAQEVTALITFRAAVYFIDDRTEAYLRGLQTPSYFQEFWMFQRQGAGWLLHGIEQSHESDRLERPNLVTDLTSEQMANAQTSITL